MCASLACQVWLNISSLARRRRHRRATVRSMRLPSVIVKKGKVVLVVVATWEQQNFLVKTPHCIEKLRKYYRNNNIASIEKAYWENLVKSQRVAGNLEYNNWNWPWIFLVKLQCALYYWLSTLCCCGFLKTEKEKKISWNHGGATVKCCQLSKWSESSNSDAVKIINIDLFCQKT